VWPVPLAVTGSPPCGWHFGTGGSDGPHKEKTMNTEQPHVYTRITNTIVADLEKGVRTWMKPWNAANTKGRITRPLRHNGEAYSGINILLLWASAIEKGFAAPTWITFNQALKLNAHVRKGEKGSLIVYANSATKKEATEEGEAEREIHFLKGYTVFNVEQIEGLPAEYGIPPENMLTPVERLAHVEKFFANTGADIRYGGNRAFYAAGPDYIQMPVIEAFRDASSFYSTLAHESCHWVGHISRLARDFGRKSWGDAGYAQEELVAELGSAFLAADLGIAPEVREDHAAYLGSWLTILRNEKRFLFTAAAHAQRAVAYLHGLQHPKTEAAP
jgi:antirestriction protein ArdC